MLIEKQGTSWTREAWQHRTRQLLQEMGTGLISASAYDTAWVARLIEQDEKLGGSALEWLCANQLPD